MVKKDLSDQISDSKITYGISEDGDYVIKDVEVKSINIDDLVRDKTSNISITIKNSEINDIGIYRMDEVTIKDCKIDLESSSDKLEVKRSTNVKIKDTRIIGAGSYMALNLKNNSITTLKNVNIVDVGTCIANVKGDLEVIDSTIENSRYGIHANESKLKFNNFNAKNIKELLITNNWYEIEEIKDSPVILLDRI